MTLVAIVLGSITGYCALVGATYAWLIAEYPKQGYADEWRGIAAVLWPLFFPACFAHSIARRRIRERQLPRAEVRRVGRS